ncbi:hypothetical protein JOD15_003025 [Enterococcus ureilyticus]|nr:hypothetical protein [Enterococcus ureilyticus]
MLRITAIGNDRADDEQYLANAVSEVSSLVNHHN